MAKVSRKPENEDLFDNGLDPVKRVVWLTGDIDLETTVRALKGLSVLDRLSEDPIILMINSEGGDMVQGFAIIDAISHCRSQVIGVVRGNAQSAAFVILQSCQVRRASKHAVLMTHAGSRTTAFDLEIDMKADEIILRRMREKDPKWTMNKLQKWQACDKYMFADEAREMGFLDEVY